VVTESANSAAHGEGALVALLAAVVDSLDEAIIGMTLDGVITTWNGGATSMYGYAPDEMIGHNISELIPADRAGELAPMLELLRTGERVGHFETQRVRKNGSVLDVSVSMSPVRDANGVIVGAASLTRDVTDRLRAEAERQVLEARLRQSERLETLGQLAGGLAHDFNNLLGVIVGYAGLLGDEVAGQAELHADVEMIEAAAERAGRLTRQLLIFSRRDIAQPQEVNLNDVIAGMSELLSASLGGGIDLRVSTGVTLPAVRADRGHLEQVLLNLAVNARDAMPGGGTLTIGTGVRILDDVYCGTHPGANPGRFVELVVSDTGAGMTAEVAERAFEPFFTTKSLGRGTGLGLATVYGIVSRAGGSISVESAEGAGTVFRAFFPALGAPPRVAATAAAGIGARILLVDDEPGVLSVTARILRKSGYVVTEAASAEEALSLASAADFRCDLLVTDSMLPHTSGTGLAERMAEMMPGIRVLHMSGYGAADISPERVERGELAFIEKPFTAPLLLQKVRTVLNGPAAG
jgi:two-component system, cell cycle sensor histidine kinase and response regulator CckA